MESNVKAQTLLSTKRPIWWRLSLEVVVEGVRHIAARPEGAFKRSVPTSKDATCLAQSFPASLTPATRE